MNIKVEDNNLIDYTNWSGLTCGDISGNGSYFNDYSIGGTTNCRVIDIDPYGNNNYIWFCSSTGATTYGGFNMLSGNYQYIDCDPTKDYRFSCWFKKTNITTKKGGLYFGCWATSGTTAQNIQNKSTGVITNNPYFVYNANIQNTDDDEWYLLVGYLYKAGTSSGGTQNSAMYNLSGNKITGYTCYDFINNSIVTDLTIKIAPIYNASGCTAYLAYPRIDLIDGTEPSIATLLQNEGMWRSGTTYIKVEDQNLDNYHNWTEGTGNLTNPTWNNYDAFSNCSSVRRLDTNPFGTQTVVWQHSGATPTTTGMRGAINMASNASNQYIQVDPTKEYRISCWINRKIINIQTNGNVYLGGWITTGTTTSQKTDIKWWTNGSVSGITNGSFYNVANAVNATTMPENQWMLLIGYIHSNAYTGSTVTGSVAYSGIYNSGGTKTLTTTDAMFLNTGATYIGMIMCGLYNAGSGATSQICYPRIDLLDGTEPSINTLLTNEGMWRSGTTMIYIDDTWKNTT